MGNRLTEIATRTGDAGTKAWATTSGFPKTACAFTPWAMWMS